MGERSARLPAWDRALSHQPPSLCYLCAKSMRLRHADAPAFFEVDDASECEADPCLTAQEMAADAAEARAEWERDRETACDCGRCDECAERACWYFESMRDDL